MRKLLVIILFLTYFSLTIQSRTDSVPLAKIRTVMIPMSDGINLPIIIPIPLDRLNPLPIVLTRTPYGGSAPKDSILKAVNSRDFQRGSSIFVH